MTSEARLFRIDQTNGKSGEVAEVDFKSLGFQERRDIQEWIVDNPSILGEKLLVVGKEFSGFDRTNERARDNIPHPILIPSSGLVVF